MPTSSRAVGSGEWGVTSTAPAPQPTPSRGVSRVTPVMPAPLGPALSLCGVGKSYNVAGRHSTTLAEQVADWVGRARTSSEANRFWALRDVTCEIGKGEIVGRYQQKVDPAKK